MIPDTVKHCKGFLWSYQTTYTLLVLAWGASLSFLMFGGFFSKLGPYYAKQILLKTFKENVDDEVLMRSCPQTVRIFP